MTQEEIHVRKNIAQRKILEAEAYLASTDYIAAKLAEGAADKSEYREELEKRQACRDTINRERESIDALDGLTPSEE